jgi:DnaJ-class molecular chaperone
MICVECNGKGYRILNHREVVCDECRGRGEHLLVEGDEHRRPARPKDPETT